MGRPKGITIYPKPELRNEIESIATKLGRSFNKQALQFLKRSVRGYKKRQNLIKRSKLESQFAAG